MDAATARHLRCFACAIAVEGAGGAAPGLGMAKSRVGPSRSNMGAWAFLKNPTERDIRGKKRRRKALDKPLSDFKYLVSPCPPTLEL